MSLPNPGMTFTPFDPLPASDLNDLVENIEGLQDTTAFDVNTDWWRGWRTPGENWAYASWDNTNKTGTIIVPTNATLKYSLGMRIRISQATGGIKYGIITGVAATVLTVYFGTDYTLNNEAISSPFYSVHKSPFGFPLDPAKWTVKVADTSSRAGTTTAGVFINPGSLAITVPIGAWDLSFEAAMTQANSSAGVYAPYGGLSTSNNSASDLELIADCISRASSTATSIWPVKRNKQITVTVATPYYLVVTCQVGGGTLTVGWEGTRQNTVMRAVCLYL